MGAIDRIRQGIAGLIWWAVGNQDEYDSAYMGRAEHVAGLLDYYEGNHPKALKIGKDRKDYNVMVNLCSLVVDRSVSMLFGGGVNNPATDEATVQYLDEQWQANKGDTLRNDLGQFGAWGGTGFLKIVPNGRENAHRLIALSPLNCSVGVNPHDIERVEFYVIRYNDGETAYREITRRAYPDGFDYHAVLNPPDTTWQVLMQKNDRDTGGRWATIDEQSWQYPFPPIVHCKNLPRAGDAYGRSDIEDVINLQNEYNSGLSNMNKVLWYHGHPRLWSKGKIGSLVDWGPEKILEVMGDNSGLYSLEMNGDMKAFRDFIGDLRRDLMDISQTTDIETIKDKAGSLTNFGLRVLFKDELSKLETKRLLYGELLTETNRRMLALDNKNPDAALPVTFEDTLPSNEVEEITAIKSDLEMGLVSKETASTRRGYEWTEEADKISNEQARQGNVGGAILTNFLRGG